MFVIALVPGRSRGADARHRDAPWTGCGPACDRAVCGSDPGPQRRTVSGEEFGGDRALGSFRQGRVPVGACPTPIRPRHTKRTTPGAVVAGRGYPVKAYVGGMTGATVLVIEDDATTQLLIGAIHKIHLCGNNQLAPARDKQFIKTKFIRMYYLDLPPNREANGAFCRIAGRCQFMVHSYWAYHPVAGHSKISSPMML